MVTQTEANSRTRAHAQNNLLARVESAKETQEHQVKLAEQTVRVEMLGAAMAEQKQSHAAHMALAEKAASFEAMCKAQADERVRTEQRDERDRLDRIRAEVRVCVCAMWLCTRVPRYVRDSCCCVLFVRSFCWRAGTGAEADCCRRASAKPDGNEVHDAVGVVAIRASGTV